MENSYKAGDFTGLAGHYSDNRPDYSPSVLDCLIGLLRRPFSTVDFVDVGAGTGIWTRMVHERSAKSVVAIEPNDDMRNKGIVDCKQTSIKFLSGSAEHTGLEDGCADFVTMASSFHWADFDPATKEFWRILRNGGIFAALWNPRLITLMHESPVATINTATT